MTARQGPESELTNSKVASPDTAMHSMAWKDVPSIQSLVACPTMEATPVACDLRSSLAGPASLGFAGDVVHNPKLLEQTYIDRAHVSKSAEECAFTALYRRSVFIPAGLEISRISCPFFFLVITEASAHLNDSLSLLEDEGGRGVQDMQQDVCFHHLLQGRLYAHGTQHSEHLVQPQGPRGSRRRHQHSTGLRKGPNVYGMRVLGLMETQASIPPEYAAGYLLPRPPARLPECTETQHSEHLMQPQ